MPIFSLIGSWIAGALFAGSTLAATLISGALAWGAQTLIGGYLARKKQRAYSAVQGETEIGGAVPVSTLYGIGRTPGHRLAYFKWGKGNKFNAEVFRLAHGWCDGLEPEIWFYGEKRALVARPIIGNEAAHYGVDGFGTLISIRFYDGRPGQLADMKLVADTAGLGKTWKATSRCTNMAYVVVERQYDKDKFKSGRPSFQFVLRGLREYDFRKDSTVAGGSGPQRLADPSTWAFTQNPAVHRLNYQLGLRGRLSGRALIGEGKSLGQLDLTSYAAAMNVCDTLRAGKPTYQCGLWVRSEDDHTEILKEFDDAMAGYGLNRGGLSGVLAGAPQLPVYDIGPDDLSMNRAAEVQDRKSAFELFNQLTGQFTSRETWEPESLTPIIVNADVAADGRPRAAANDFLQVLDPDIAQYLLKIRYRQNRKGGQITLPVSRRCGLACVEGSWVTHAGRTWLVRRRQLEEGFRFTLALAETGADVYSDAGIDPGPIVVAPPVLINPSLLSNVQNFGCQVGQIAGADGSSVPALRFTWTPPDDPTITALHFYYYRDGAPATVYEDRCNTPEAGEYITSKDVMGGVFYVARQTISTEPPRFTTFSPWITTLAPTGGAFWPVDVDALEDDVRDLMDWTGSGLRDTLDLLRNLETAISDAALTNFVISQGIRTELTASYEDARAKYTSAINAATGPGSALVARMTSMEALIGTKASASLLEQTILRVTATEDATTTLAAQYTSLSATLASKADASVVAAMSATVTAQGDTISSQGAAIIAVQNELHDPATGLASKASNAAVFSLSSDLATVTTTVNSKNRVFRQSTAPAATAVGDLWIHTGDGNRLYRASAVGTGNWVLSEDQRIPQLVTDVAANTSAITALQTNYNGVSANATFRMDAGYTPGAGYTARIGLEARIDSGATFRSAGLYADVSATQARLILNADQVIIQSGGTLTALFDAGTAYIRSAVVNVLSSPDGKFVITLSQGKIEWFE